MRDAIIRLSIRVHSSFFRILLLLSLIGCLCQVGREERMKTLLMSIDVIFNVISWLVFLAVIGVASYLWYTGEIGWRGFGLVLAAVCVAGFVVGVLYRVVLFQFRSLVIYEIGMENVRAGLIDKEGFEAFLREWRQNKAMHIAFGFAPHQWGGW
jgi:hypothetical protein